MKDRILNGLMLLFVFAALISVFWTGGEKRAAGGTNEIVSMETEEEGEDPVVSYRERRRALRSEEKSALLSLIGKEEKSAESRALAEKQLLDMCQSDETELAVEAALLSRGYERALCVARQGEVYVFLPQEVTEKDAKLFLEIAHLASQADMENIRVSGYAF